MAGCEQPESRRFPLPWSVAGNDSCDWVEDAEGKRFAYTYFHDEGSSIGTSSAGRLTRREALRIVRNVVKLPELLTAQHTGPMER